ncbi:hypothetical protein PHYSODRAFT_431150, partial [Phytophthora sojae]
QIRRKRRRMTQQRYRKKIEDKATTLAKDVGELRDDIKRAKMQLRVLTIYTGMDACRAAVEYVRLFRYGRNKVQNSRKMMLRGDEDAQWRFLQAVVISNVASNRGFGVDVILEGWELLSSRLGCLEIQLVDLDYEAKTLIIADVKCFATITERMLRDALGGQSPIVAWNPLGQRLAVPGRVRFEWDDAKLQFVSIFFEIDMLTPLMELLGNLEDVCMALNSSL